MSPPLVYFYLPENDDVYFDAPLVLAEGLQELGVPFVANRDYWRTSPASNQTLFRRSPGVAHQDADVVVIHDDWFYYYPQSTLRIRERPAPAELFVARRRYRLVYLDTWVGARTNSWSSEFRHCDLILRAQYNRRASYPSNVKPWALGFTTRVVTACGGLKPFSGRRHVLVENFSYTHPFRHGVRELFEQRLVPRLQGRLEVDRQRSAADSTALSAYDRLMWEQTVDKHNPDYYERLTSSTLVAAFCGYLAPGFPSDASVHFRGEKRFQALSVLTRGLAAVTARTPRLIQWDSWRFWESLCAGAIPVHLDLEKYGVELPVMPENGRHYLGLDLERIDAVVDRVCSGPEALEPIAEAGRAWALEHYSPKATAKRFLAELGFGVPGSSA